MSPKRAEKFPEKVDARVAAEFRIGCSTTSPFCALLMGTVDRPTFQPYITFIFYLTSLLFCRTSGFRRGDKQSVLLFYFVTLHSCVHPNVSISPYGNSGFFQ